MTDAHAKRFLFDWEDVALRARISANAKLVAFAMKKHANLDGTNVRPGNALLCVLTGLSYSAVTRAIKELVKAGLIVLVCRGNRRKRRADEYRLIFAEDLLDRIAVLSPSETKAAAEKIIDERQAADAAARRKTSVVPETTEESPEDDVDQWSQGPLEQVSVVSQTRDQWSQGPPTIPSDQSTKSGPSQSVGNATHHPREDDCGENRLEGKREATADTSPPAPSPPVTAEAEKPTRSEIEMVRTALHATTGTTVDDDHAVTVIEQIFTGRPKVRHRLVYLDRAIRNDDNPARYLKTRPTVVRGGLNGTPLDTQDPQATSGAPRPNLTVIDGALKASAS